MRLEENTWPDVVEIEVNTNCNRRCSYCPNSLPGASSLIESMPEELFRKIIFQLGEIGFSGRLSFHFFNEPLLREDLQQLIAWARPCLPLAYFVLYTNGDLLDDTHYTALLDAGVDKFLVTRHSWDHYQQRPFQQVQVPSNFTISGRGGTISASNTALDIPCYGPSEMMIVIVNGDVVLCHEDANRRFVFGNLTSKSISQVWHSETFLTARRALRRGRTGEVPCICAICDNRLYPIPGAAI